MDVNFHAWMEFFVTPSTTLKRALFARNPFIPFIRSYDPNHRDPRILVFKQSQASEVMSLALGVAESTPLQAKRCI